jgi:hypothetical protein
MNLRSRQHPLLLSATDARSRQHPLLLSMHVALSVCGLAEALTLLAVIQPQLAITPLLLAVIFEKGVDRTNAEDLTAYRRSDLQR